MKLLFPIFFSFVLWVWFSGCSINLQDPQDELDEIIYKNSPWSLNSLEGEWLSQSKYDSGKNKLTSHAGIQFEILKDSSFSLKDNSQLLFPTIYSGNISWEPDKNILRFNGKDQDGENLKLNLKGLLYFEGNYLNLFLKDSEDYIHFEKTPVPEPSEFERKLKEQQDSSSKIWEYVGYRLSNDQKIVQNYLGEIAYYIFEDKQLTILKSLRGQRDSLTLDFTLVRDSLNIFSSNGMESFHLDYFHTTQGQYDSLRVWPLQSHKFLRLDSIPTSEVDFILFNAVKTKHPNYLDLSYLTADYWKADSITYLRNSVESHFGQYYDMMFYPDGELKILSNNPKWPVYNYWNVINGNLSLETDSSQIVVTATHHQGRLTLKGSSFSATLAAADSESIAQDPLSRFPNQDYFHLFYNGDTLRYYFDSKSVHYEDGIDSIQIYQKDGDYNYALGFTAKPGKDKDGLFQNDKEGYFIFAQMKLSPDSLARVHSDSSLEFEEGTSIRSFLDTKTGMVTGTLTEGKLIDKYGQNYTVSGKFRYGITPSKPMDQNLWISSNK